MAKTTLGSRITDIVARAAKEIAAAVRSDLGHGVQRLVGRRRGRPPAQPTAARGAPAAKARRRRGSGPDAATLDRLLKLISSHPGLRAEQIRGQVSLDAASVKAGLAKLRETRQVKTRGQRRATTYAVA